MSFIEFEKNLIKSIENVKNDKYSLSDISIIKVATDIFVDSVEDVLKVEDYLKKSGGLKPIVTLQTGGTKFIPKSSNQLSLRTLNGKNTVLVQSMDLLRTDVQEIQKYIGNYKSSLVVFMEWVEKENISPQIVYNILKNSFEIPWSHADKFSILNIDDFSKYMNEDSVIKTKNSFILVYEKDDEVYLKEVDIKSIKDISLKDIQILFL